MNNPSFKINPFTLHFPKGVEVRIRAKIIDELFPIYLVAIRVILFSVLGLICFDQFVLQSDLSRFRLPLELVFLVIFLLVSVAGTHLKKIFNHTIRDDLLICLFITISICTFFFSVAELAPRNNLNVYGLCLLFIFVNATLPISFIPKSTICLIYCIGLIGIADFYSPFPATKTFDLARQILLCFIFHTVMSYVLEMFIRRQVVLAEILDLESAKVDKLLLNVLPSTIAQRLKSGEENIVDKAESVTILFADIVGFTQIVGNAGASETVKILNDIFSRFDLSAEMHGVEKIKTMGDSYFAVCGIPDFCHNHAERVARLALDFQQALTNYSNLMNLKLEIRIGINTGPVVAGIIGTKKFLYDLWGDTVNLASRMESQGEPSKIQVTQSTYDALKGQFKFSEPKTVFVKGKGEVVTYFLLEEV